MTGHYARRLFDYWRALPLAVADNTDRIEAQGEIIGFFLRRLHILESQIVALREPLAELKAEVASLSTPLKAVQDEVASWIEPVQALTGKPSEATVPLQQSTVGSAASGGPPAPEKPYGNVGIICTSLGRRCGIAEYATLLAERLHAALVSAPAELPPDTAVAFLQYEPALYPRQDDLLREISLVNPSVITVVDAHHITAEVAEELRWHAIVGVKRGYHPGTVRLSHIQQIPIPEDQDSVEKIHLGAFGFALPHKHYENIIELAQRLGVGATILASHNNATPEIAEESSAYLAHLRSLANGNIEIIDDFLANEEVIKRLRRCSHLVSCMEDNAAQSGSLRIMAAAGRPLICLRNEQARDVGATLVDDLAAIDIDFLKNCRQVPRPHDGIADYHGLLQRLTWAKNLIRPIYHGDNIYLDDSRQMERLNWLREKVVGNAIDIGIGNGFSANYIRAVAGVDIRPDRVSYASLRYPHLEFRVLDARLQALAGYDSVILAEIIEHMSFEEAASMLALWANTNPARILVTTPNAAKTDYDHELVHNPEHVWLPTPEMMDALTPSGYSSSVSTSEGNDFLLVTMTRQGS